MPFVWLGLMLKGKAKAVISHRRVSCHCSVALTTNVISRSLRLKHFPDPCLYIKKWFVFLDSVVFHSLPFLENNVNLVGVRKIFCHPILSMPSMQSIRFLRVFGSARPCLAWCRQIMLITLTYFFKPLS